MSTRNLDGLVEPRSVVAIGASARKGSVGEAVTRNLLGGGFKGEIHLVNVKGGEIAGRPVRRSLAELPAPADLAIVMTPPDSVPGLIADLGARGTKVAVVITAGPGAGPLAQVANAQWRERLLAAARPRLLRIVGPNCIGYAAPRIGLNASFGPGNLKRRWPTGALRRASASRISCRWATWPTSISATCSTSCRAISRRTRS
jgi:acetyltransferase